jgi:hypothetical protein
MLSTLDQIRERLVSDSLVRRYRIGNAVPDGLQGQEGTLNLCTFWLVEALTRAGHLSETRLLFEKMLSYADHLGFYAEELSLAGERLGNFPQAITHMGFISAAYNLNMALEKEIETGWGGTEMPHVCRTPKAMQRPVPIHLACDQGEMAPSTELRRGKEQAHA